MSYEVIARKWRPQFFEDLIGQEHVAKTLSNSINAKRIAHGYLFAGPRGVGKTSTARIFAKSLNCPNSQNGKPCNTCSTCIEISNGHGMDVIEIDGASNNSVDNIRDLRENIRFTPTSGQYKIYIIDEVHMLSKGAFNALLKTLEEPPKHAVFIFATTEIHKVLPTILSRCQRFDFKRIPIVSIVKTLNKICQSEQIEIAENGLLLVAKKADGSMRDAQSILDQLISFCGQTITEKDIQSVLGIINQELFFQMCSTFINKDTANGFTIIESLFQEGYDLTEVISGLEEHLRHLLVCISTGSADLIDTGDEFKQKYLEQSQSLSEKDILRIIDILEKTEQLIKSGNHPRIKLELAFSKICQMDKSVEISELINQFSQEKKKPEIASDDQAAKKIPIESIPNNIIEKKEASITEAKEENKSPVTEPPQNNNIISTGNSNSESNVSSIRNNHYENKETQELPKEDESNNKNHASEIDSKNENLDKIQTAWLGIIDHLKTSKPTLAACLGQSHLNSVDQDSIYLIFDDTEVGKFNLNTFNLNKELIAEMLNKKVSKLIKFKTSLKNFDELGVKIANEDLQTVVNRLRQKDKIVDSAMNMFKLEAISFSGKK